VSPTLALFLFVLAAALFAYEVVYPRIVGGSARRLVVADIVLTAVSLTLVGLKYGGTGTPFNFGLFETNWAIATILFYLLVESVLATRYCIRHGIRLGDFGE
jgi:hypothetical protein